MANSELGLLGRKLGMTQLFDDDGTIVPVTVVEAGPCTVVQVKTVDSDGYDAIQLGFGSQKEHRVSKAQLGHYGKSESSPAAWVGEIRVRSDEVAKLDAGDTLGAADVFTEGTYVDVTGTSKGRGFSGVMRRHNFAGFERTHGTHEFFRHGGSIGTRLTPGHVLKGKKMPGHMGSEQVTVQNLRVARVDAERSLVFVRGAIPGPKGGYVKVRRSVKKTAS